MEGQPGSLGPSRGGGKIPKPVLRIVLLSSPSIAVNNFLGRSLQTIDSFLEAAFDKTIQHNQLRPSATCNVMDGTTARKCEFAIGRIQ
jgi:hypothetical protein